MTILLKMNWFLSRRVKTAVYTCWTCFHIDCTEYVLYTINISHSKAQAPSFPAWVNFSRNECEYTHACENSRASGMLSELNALIYSPKKDLLRAYDVAAFGDACIQPCSPAPWSCMGLLSEMPWMECFHVSTFWLISWTANSMSQTRTDNTYHPSLPKIWYRGLFSNCPDPCEQGLCTTYPTCTRMVLSNYLWNNSCNDLDTCA